MWLGDGVCGMNTLLWVHTSRILIHDMLDIVIGHRVSDVSDSTGAQDEVSDTWRDGQHLDIGAEVSGY